MITDAPPLSSLELLTGSSAEEMLHAAVDAADGTLISWRPKQVAHQPGGGTTAAYATKVRWRGGRVSDETFAAVSGTSTLPQGALIVGNGDHTAAVWRFPFDPELPGLRHAFDPGHARQLLADLGLRHGGGVGVRVRAYRPMRRAVVELTGGTRRVFLKAVRVQKVAALHERHRLLEFAGVPVPGSLGWTADGIVVLEALKGRTLRKSLASGQWRPPRGSDLVALLDRFPADLARGDRRASWLDKVHHYASVVGTALPCETARAGDIAGAISERAAHGPTVAVHGDFYENQLMVEDGRVTGLLDIDTAGGGDRIDDLACCLGHLDVLGQIRPARRAALHTLRAAWQGEFERTVPADQLRLRTAAVVMSLAPGPHRVQEQGWPDATRRRLALAEDWLASAARGGEPG